MNPWREMAEKYYPRLWGSERIQALVEAARLTREEAEEIVTGHGKGGTAT